MSDGKLNKQTGVYRWAGGAILEDWSRPPGWFTEPFVNENVPSVPPWLLDLYEKWANGEGFYVRLTEIEDALSYIEDANQQQASRFAFARLIRQPGFQWYPKTQEYGYAPPVRGDDMGRSVPLKPTNADFPPDVADKARQAMVEQLVRRRAQEVAPRMDPKEAAEIARELGKQYRAMMAARGVTKQDVENAGKSEGQSKLDKITDFMAALESEKQVPSAVDTAIADYMESPEYAEQKRSLGFYNGDPSVPISGLTVSELAALGTMGRPIGPDEYSARTTSDKPLMSPSVSPRTDVEKLKPIPGVDTSTAAAVNVRTPKNSSKAAWSSKTLRELQANLATYDAETAQLFTGLAQVLATATRRGVSVNDLDFDVNFGSPIRNNERQLSVTVRKPTECRVSITQTLQPDGTMTWDAEVWDMTGIPSGSNYRNVRERIKPTSVPALPNAPDRGAPLAAARTSVPEASDAPPPRKDPKRPRQVRI
jgi:hypothetical protein